MNKLRAYLDGRPKGEFARKVGIVPAYLSQILMGVKRPSFDLMLRIEAETGGLVDLQSWAPTGSAPVPGASRSSALPAQKDVGAESQNGKGAA